MGGLQLRLQTTRIPRFYQLSYLLLDVHVHFISSAHCGAGCFCDIRTSESLVVLVVVVLLLVVCCCCCVWSCTLLCVLSCVLFVWCVLYVCVVSGFVVCCTCMLPWHLPECFVVNTRELRQRLSCLDLSSRLFTLTRFRGLTLTSARVLVRARVDGPGSQPTDALDHTSCLPCSHAHFGRGTTACVSSPKRRHSLQRLAHAAGHGLCVASINALSFLVSVAPQRWHRGVADVCLQESFGGLRARRFRVNVVQDLFESSVLPRRGRSHSLTRGGVLSCFDFFCSPSVPYVCAAELFHDLCLLAFLFFGLSFLFRRLLRLSLSCRFLFLLCARRSGAVCGVSVTDDEGTAGKDVVSNGGEVYRKFRHTRGTELSLVCFCGRG